MTNRRSSAPRILTEEERAPLFAAYDAAREEVEYLDGELSDDAIIHAAYEASAPMAQALALRQAADEMTAWSDAAEWLRRRADQIESEGRERAERTRARRERQRPTVTILSLVDDTTEES